MLKKLILASLIALQTTTYADTALITISPTFQMDFYQVSDAPTLIEKGKYIVFKANKEGNTWTAIPNTDRTINNRTIRNPLLSASGSVDFNNIPDLNVKTAQEAYDYIINNIKYDYDLAKQITDGTASNNVRTASKTLETKKGVCYDYSILFAGICRKNGIPTAVVKGTYKGQQHAWNTINGVIWDTTLEQINKNINNYK